MIEVVFSDSEKGSMRVGGNSKDVVHIGFSLDIGDISGGVDGNERQSVYRELWGRFDFDDKEQEQFFQNQCKDMERLITDAKEGTPIRIWKSNAPYSTCGFHYVCFMLRNIDCRISVVSLPEYRQASDHEIIRHSHWGEIHAGKLYQFLPLERELSRLEKQAVSDHWQNLMKENAPLRAIVNGKLISVPDDFYDFIISKNIPDHDFIMARFIGSLLGEYNLGISDTWYALRIERMIEGGKLMVAENGDQSHPYGKVLRRKSR